MSNPESLAVQQAVPLVRQVVRFAGYPEDRVTRVGTSIVVMVGEGAAIEYDRQSAYSLTKGHYSEDREVALNG
jgi:hypothetical protein